MSSWIGGEKKQQQAQQQQQVQSKIGLAFFGKKVAPQHVKAAAGIQRKERARYPYIQHKYIPDEQVIVEEDERAATVEITATQQELLVDKQSRTVFTLDEDPVEIGVWVECVQTSSSRMIA